MRANYPCFLKKSAVPSLEYFLPNYEFSWIFSFIDNLSERQLYILKREAVKLCVNVKKALFLCFFAVELFNTDLSAAPYCKNTECSFQSGERCLLDFWKFCII